MAGKNGKDGNDADLLEFGWHTGLARLQKDSGKAGLVYLPESDLRVS